MSALDVGKMAPEVSLPTLDGKQFSLAEARRRGPVVLAFYKIGCPVCQFTFPYLERIYQKLARGKSNVSFVGVSQDDKQGTESFVREYKLTFPQLLEDTKKWAVSNAYGLSNVPSIFYIAPDGSIELSIVGWDRKAMDELNQKLAGALSEPVVPVFSAGEEIPDYKPG